MDEADANDTGCGTPAEDAIEWLPELCKPRAKGAAMQLWRIGVWSTGSRAILVTRSGIAGSKTKQNVREVKRVGRQSSVLEQARAQSKKKWRDRQDKEGWQLCAPDGRAAPAACETAETAETAASDNEAEAAGAEAGAGGSTFFTPMLAKPLMLRTRKARAKGAAAGLVTQASIAFPCAVQPKLDGLRCVAVSDGPGIALLSRNNVPFVGLPSIKRAVSLVMPLFQSHCLYLDGELWSGDVPFEQLSGALRSAQHHQGLDVPGVRYHIFDCYDKRQPDMPFSARAELLARLLGAPNCPPELVLVPTARAESWEDVLAHHARFLAAGNEGLIARALDAPYAPCKRSAALQKYKEFHDAEYDIVGFEEAEGADAGTVVWVCATPDGTRFSVRPRGTREARAAAFQNAAAAVGKRLTVVYQELSAAGVPRFPVGKCIREVDA